jgi:Bacterial aa3 type cytochrome c oxidase subunit IV
MADHGEVEYATADGNDYAEHEGTYENFVHLVVIGILYVINICVALTVGGVVGFWFRCAAILIVGTIVAAHGLLSKSTMPSAVMVVLSFLILAASTLG